MCRLANSEVYVVEKIAREQNFSIWYPIDDRDFCMYDNMKLALCTCELVNGFVTVDEPVS